jgi:transcriptional regulator with AAA-type ATPase domain/NAD-dependent dihydropyrimidine dehydrogenase PreA subunit
MTPCTPYFFVKLAKSCQPIINYREGMVMDPSERVQWLKTHTSLALLADTALGAIAQAMQLQHVQANRRLVLEDTLPPAVYFLKSGQMESYRTSLTGPAQATSLLPGAVVYLRELLLDLPAERTLITLTDCQVWTIAREEVLALIQQHPDINQVFSRQLAAELDAVSAQLVYEQESQIALRPYLIPKVRRGIIGASRYAVRLRQSIRKASGDRQPVLIFGEPGLDKDNAAALIHFGSRDRRQPLIQINCDTVQASGTDVFGRSGGKRGLLDWIGSGTVIFNNVQELSSPLQERLLHLLETGTYTPIQRDNDVPAIAQHCDARIILTSERTLPNIQSCGAIAHLIKVPPLRVRKADIDDLVSYYISLLCRDRGLSKPTVDPKAIRSLQGYDFPGNIAELEGMVNRALIQANREDLLTEEIFWPESSKKRRFRLNLLNVYPTLRNVLRSPWWPDRINYGVTVVAFAVVVGLLFLGPQTRDQNIALTLFWAWWWPIVLIIFPFLGRIWCAVCPFMIYGEITQKLSLWLFPRTLWSWPRQQADRWGGWFLFGLFVLILLWEELWNLPNVAYLSAWLLLLITAGAMICSALFERRFWCRYLCPIGGMNGLFAKLSMTELRAQQGICSATCTTYQCYKGGPEKGEGQETNGCPIYSHPAQLQDNRDCVLCMTCLKACPHRSVEFNLRPPAIELWTTHTPTAHEVALLFLLMGAVCLHHLPTLQQWLPIAVSLEDFWPHVGLSIVALSLPGAIALLAHRLTRLSNLPVKQGLFIRLAYGYLPLALGGNLAHYLNLGLTEGGRILPVTFATFGLNGSTLPVAVAHPAVLAFLQGVTLIVATWLSVFVTQNIARQPIWKLLPQHLALFATGIVFWSVILD